MTVCRRLILGPSISQIWVPDLGLAGLLVMPDDVGVPVAGHITHADDLEGKPHKDRLVVLVRYGGSPRDLATVHLPDLGLVGIPVMPDDDCRRVDDYSHRIRCDPGETGDDALARGQARGQPSSCPSWPPLAR